MITLTYNANGGDTTPKTQTSDAGVFTLAKAITKAAPTSKFSFVGWKIGDTVYNAESETAPLASDSEAIAQWKLNETTVSPKSYGYSPNGTKNPLGKTRYHHQPNYPKPMGV